MKRFTASKNRGQSIPLLLLFLFTIAVPARADTVASMTTAQLNALYGASPTSTQTSAFSVQCLFAAGCADGTVTSSAFTGTGSATGLYAYVYQIAVNDLGSDSGSVTGFSALFPGFQSGSEFFLSDGSGTLAPGSASYPNTINGFSPFLTFSFQPTSIANGVTTYDFGAISNYAPATGVARMTTSGPNCLLCDQLPTVIQPGVAPVTSAPEPSSLLLLGSGLMALALRKGAKHG
jgi:hypothetical protein